MVSRSCNLMLRPNSTPHHAGIFIEHPRQHACPPWIIGGGSRKGMDLTLRLPAVSLPSSASETDSEPTHGGILLRTIRRVKDRQVVSGPSRLVDEILAQSGAQSILDLVQPKWKEDTFAFHSNVPGSRPSLRIIPPKEFCNH